MYHKIQWALHDMVCWEFSKMVAPHIDYLSHALEMFPDVWEGNLGQTTLI